MYRSYYKLTSKPFQISSDPKFLWLGEKHKEALAFLEYGILDNKGFLLLTGDVGTGKSTLINALLNNIGDEIVAANVPVPGLKQLDLFNFIAHAFKINKRFQNKVTFLVHFSNFLRNLYTNNKKVLLIIDDAQRLNQELLEEIRLLSNIENQDTKLINIFFVGQNEFNDMLLDHRNRALRHRIILNYKIGPLTESETGRYIRHRLIVSGSKRIIFTSDAISEIFSSSKGFPRQINIICDLAMLTGYVEEKKKINAAIIKKCAEQLKNSFQTNHVMERFRKPLEAAKGSPLQQVAGSLSLFTQPIRSVSKPCAKPFVLFGKSIYPSETYKL